MLTQSCVGACVFLRIRLCTLKLPGLSDKSKICTLRNKFTSEICKCMCTTVSVALRCRVRQQKKQQRQQTANNKVPCLLPTSSHSHGTVSGTRTLTYTTAGTVTVMTTSFTHHTNIYVSIPTHPNTVAARISSDKHIQRAHLHVIHGGLYQDSVVFVPRIVLHSVHPTYGFRRREHVQGS